VAAPAGDHRPLRPAYLCDDVADGASPCVALVPSFRRLLQHLASGVGAACAGDVTGKSIQRQPVPSRAERPGVLGRDAGRGAHRGPPLRRRPETRADPQPDAARRHRRVGRRHVHARAISVTKYHWRNHRRHRVRLRSLPGRSFDAPGAAVDDVDPVGVLGDAAYARYRAAEVRPPHRRIHGLADRVEHLLRDLPRHPVAAGRGCATRAGGPIPADEDDRCIRGRRGNRRQCGRAVFAAISGSESACRCSGRV
jgi:hypothetical protein